MAPASPRDVNGQDPCGRGWYVQRIRNSFLLYIVRICPTLGSMHIPLSWVCICTMSYIVSATRITREWQPRAIADAHNVTRVHYIHVHVAFILLRHANAKCNSSNRHDFNTSRTPHQFFIYIVQHQTFFNLKDLFSRLFAFGCASKARIALVNIELKSP